MSSPHELYDEAIRLKDAGDLPGCVDQLRQIAKDHPDHSDTHSALAVYLQKLGQFDEAIEHAKKVCELAPHDAFSFTQLSVIYVKCGRIPEAEDARAKAHAVQAGGQS
ncbi:MAG: tetratricopeptide repeat protein [Planctomycetaceae bacterium]|nr:tetratricopeptide repeat protein [Planctomycetaceae bacterium]